MQRGTETGGMMQSSGQLTPRPRMTCFAALRLRLELVSALRPRLPSLIITQCPRPSVIPVRLLPPRPPKAHPAPITPAALLRTHHHHHYRRRPATP